MTVLAVTPIPEEYEAFTKALADFGHAGVCRGVGKLTATAFDDGKIIVAQGGLGKAQFGVQTQHLIDNLDNIGVVVCAGTCGRLDDTLSVGDVVIGTHTVEHDFNRGMALIKLPLPTFEGDAGLIGGITSVLLIGAPCPATCASAASQAATKASQAKSASANSEKAPARSSSHGKAQAALAQPSSPASPSLKFAASPTARARTPWKSSGQTYPLPLPTSPPSSANCPPCSINPSRDRRAPPDLAKQRQNHRRASQPEQRRCNQWLVAHQQVFRVLAGIRAAAQHDVAEQPERYEGNSEHHRVVVG